MKSTLMIAGVVAVVIGWYALGCWWRPLAYCSCCKGSGRHARKDGKVFRNCWWCKGSGRRWRIGRRVWNFFHRRVHT
jgi:hypothetical protein